MHQDGTGPTLVGSVAPDGRYNLLVPVGADAPSASYRLIVENRVVTAGQTVSLTPGTPRSAGTRCR